jgi:TonB family protein
MGMVLRSNACWTPDHPGAASDESGYEITSRDTGAGRMDPAARAYVIDAVHPRIHSKFSDDYLPKLDGLLPYDRMNQGAIWAIADIHVRADGALESVQISRPSGIADFDRAVVTAVEQSAPYPPPPASIVRGTGITLRWTFARPQVLGCSARDGRVWVVY